MNHTTFALFNRAAQLPISVNRSADFRMVFLTTGLPPSSLITVIATSDVTDISGNRLDDYVSQFTTAPAVDTTTPFVVTMRPGSGATDVAPQGL